MPVILPGRLSGLMAACICEIERAKEAYKVVCKKGVLKKDI